jgi:hypothetical protein
MVERPMVGREARNLGRGDVIRPARREIKGCTTAWAPGSGT